MQNKADRSNMNGYPIIIPKRGNSSNSLNFKQLYSLYRLTEIFRIIDEFNKKNNRRTLCLLEKVRKEARI